MFATVFVEDFVDFDVTLFDAALELRFAEIEIFGLSANAIVPADLFKPDITR